MRQKKREFKTMSCKAKVGKKEHNDEHVLEVSYHTDNYTRYKASFE